MKNMFKVLFGLVACCLVMGQVEAVRLKNSQGFYLSRSLSSSSSGIATSSIKSEAIDFSIEQLITITTGFGGYTFYLSWDSNDWFVTSQLKRATLWSMSSDGKSFSTKGITKIYRATNTSTKLCFNSALTNFIQLYRNELNRTAVNNSAGISESSGADFTITAVCRAAFYIGNTKYYVIPSNNWWNKTPDDYDGRVWVYNAANKTLTAGSVVLRVEE